MLSPLQHELSFDQILNENAIEMVKVCSWKKHWLQLSLNASPDWLLTPKICSPPSGKAPLLFCSPVFFMPPVINYMLFYITLPCEKLAHASGGRKRYMPTKLGGAKQKRSDFGKISRKSYIIFLWVMRSHTTDIWHCSITKNLIWPGVKESCMMGDPGPSHF